jgi:hypothetical protein
MKWAGHLRIWVRYTVALAIVLGSSLPAWSHNEPAVIFSSVDASSPACQTHQLCFPRTQSTSPSMPEAPLATVFFTLMAIAAAYGLRHRRRMAVLGLVLVISTFTFGTAVHAVHHLSDPGKAAECLVFSASQHVSGTFDAPCDLCAPAAAVKTALPTNPEVPTLIRRCGADLPRAPPSFLS